MYAAERINTLPRSRRRLSLSKTPSTQMPDQRNAKSHSNRFQIRKLYILYPSFITFDQKCY